MFGRSMRYYGCALASLLLATAVFAQAPTDVRILPVDVPSRTIDVQIDSGLVANLGDVQAPVYETVVTEPDATWLRLFFTPETRIRPGSQLRLTSLLDGAVQLLDAESLEQWRHSTAYFNGDRVKIEILAAGGSSGNRVALDLLHAGIPGGVLETICGNDDRVLSSDPRSARLLSAGCTGWLINECFLTAGHCLGNTVAQFNVPLSTSTGSLVHPPPSDQYAIDESSKQGTGSGVGNDWGYFGVFANSTTGLTPLEAQGARYTLATNVPSVSGQDIRIIGYGVDSTPPDYNQVQQINDGPYREFTGTTVRYETDTTGGNSGSAVHDLSTDRAIGIHTHAGCDTSPPPYNQGTAINHSGLQVALRNPAGVCADQPACTVNGICDAGEDCFSCPDDCAYAAPPSAGGAPVCGNGICEVAQGEDCNNCPFDCNLKSTGRPDTRYCCGIDVGCEEPGCTANGNTCSDSTDPSGSGYCCGDAVCEGGEDTSSCAVDCMVNCSVPADCDDGNECTTDDCVAGSCQNSAVADDTTCDAGAGLCCSGACTTAACDFDTDCDDGDVCTDDACLDGGTCGATCDNTPAADPQCCTPTHVKEKGPRCSDGLDNDCDGLIDGADPDC